MSDNLLAFTRHQPRQAYGPRAWPLPTRPGPASRIILHSGQHLFHAGEQGQDAYLVRSGNMKTYATYKDGEEQILGLHGPGDVLGFDALLGQTWMCSARAVDTVHVQILPCPARVRGEEGESEVTQVLLLGMYQELLRYTRLLHMDRHPTERRLAEFLLDFSDRQCQRGYSCDHLMLPVSRRDLAGYLGLAPETLSRTLSCFQGREILDVDNRDVTILDRDALRVIAGV